MGEKRLRWVLLWTAAVLLPALMMAMTLYNNGWDPSSFIGFGEEAVENRRIASEMLGRDVMVRPVVGHDGRFFFIQAVDPWISDRDMYVAALDRPVYRAQRSMYPILAGGLGLFTAEATLWGMMLVNFAALVGGSVLAGRLLALRGVNPLFGLLFVANPGVWSEVAVSGAGVLAMCLLLAAVLAIERRWFGVAAACLTGMALSREVMLLSVIPLAWLYLGDEWRARWPVYAVPFGAVLGWGAYVRFRLPRDPEALAELGFPFAGWAAAFDHWVAMPIDGLTAAAVLAMGIYLVAKFGRSTDGVVWAGAPLAILAVVLTEQVVAQRFNLTRALAPVVLSFGFLVLAELKAANALGSNTRSVGP